MAALPTSSAIAKDPAIVEIGVGAVPPNAFSVEGAPPLGASLLNDIAFDGSTTAAPPRFPAGLPTDLGAAPDTLASIVGASTTNGASSLPLPDTLKGAVPAVAIQASTTSRGTGASEKSRTVRRVLSASCSALARERISSSE